MTERSKIAARQQNAAKCRRERENTVLVELSRLLPIPFSVAVRLDKASVVRLSSAYLKLRELFPSGIGREWGEKSQPDGILKELGTFLNSAFDGFVFVLGDDAKILYVSEAASTHLGLSQLELIGNSLFNFIHEYDNPEVKKLICHEQSIPALYAGNIMHEDIEVPRNFEIRMKCTLPKRQAELAVDGYKVIHCRGYLKLRQKTENFAVSDPSVLWYRVIGIVAAGHSLPSASIAEVKMHRNDFMFRTGLDMKFIYLEPRSEEIIGYEPSYLIDKSLYKFVHPRDCSRLQDAHLQVLTRSQSITKYYRFLTRGGGWIWIQSSCMVISSNKANSQHYILVLNHVLSGREHEDILLDDVQLHKPRTKSFKSYSNFAKRSQKTRKKAMSLNLISNSVHQISPSQPATSLQESNLNHSQEKHLSQETAYVRNNLDLLDFNAETLRGATVTSHPSGASFDNSELYNSPSCSDSIYNVNSYDNTCSSIINRTLTNPKFDVPCMELSSTSSITCPSNYFNDRGTLSSLPAFIQNSAFESSYLESTNSNYLCDAAKDKDFASSLPSCFSPLAKKAKTDELPTVEFSTNSVETNYINENIEVTKFTNSCNPHLVAKIEMSKAPADLSTTQPIIHSEQNNLHFLDNTRIYVPGGGELTPHSSFHSNEVSCEMFSYPNDKIHQFNNSAPWNQSLSVTTADLNQINNLRLTSDIDSAAAEKQTPKRVDVEVIYSSDKSQNSLHNIPGRESFAMNTTNKNCINFNVPPDFQNVALSDSKETLVATNIPAETSIFTNLSDHNGMTPCEQTIDSGKETMTTMSPNDTAVLSTLQSSIPFSVCDEFVASNTDHFQNTDNFPVFSDIVNLITNADIFPRMNTDQAYRDLGFSNDNNNNPLQLSQGQNSSNKVIYISQSS